MNFPHTHSLTRPAPVAKFGKNSTLQDCFCLSKSLLNAHTQSYDFPLLHAHSQFLLRTSTWQQQLLGATRLQSVCTLPFDQSVKVEPTKSSCQCHRQCVPNKDPGSIECISVMCQRAGTKPGATVDGLLEIRLRYQNQRVENLSPMTLSFCRIFWFSEIRRQSSLDEKCRYLLLKTVYFLLLFCCYRGTGYLLFALCYCLNRMLIKG